MAGDALRIGVSGLMAFQRALGTIGHNITNVNSEGYTRQTTELQANDPIPNSAGFIGNGVHSVTTKRTFDQHATNQVRSRSSASEYFGIYDEMASQIDNLMADKDAGISSAIQSFFKATHGVSVDPTSTAAREVMLTEGRGLVDRFHTMDSWLGDLTKTTNQKIVSLVDEVNSFARNISSLNNEIVVAAGLGGGQPPNDLMDRRDLELDKLSKLVGIKTNEQVDGAVNVFIGNGQSLVVGTAAQQFIARPDPNDPENYEVAYVNPGSATVYSISNNLTGGTLGGIMGFREQILKPAKNFLGQVATGIAMTFNDQQSQGVDLYGKLGVDIFVEPTPATSSAAANTGGQTASATISNVAQLTPDDYILKYDGVNYALTNSTSGVVTNLVISAAGPPIAFNTVDGLDIQLTNTPAVNDRFFIRPTRNASRSIDMAMTDPREVAAAGPVNTVAAKANLGGATIGQATVVDLTNAAFTTVQGALSPPILIQFDNPAAAVPMSYSIIDATTNAVLEANIAYDPSNPLVGHDVFPSAGALDYGYRVKIDGNPQPGDQFSVSFNNTGVSDNRNALLLAAMQDKPTLGGGNSTYSETYSDAVVFIGNRTRQAQINKGAQQALFTQAIERRESISGVNMDEEAANMLRYQQAYQAAARLIATANSLFDTLISVVRS